MIKVKIKEIAEKNGVTTAYQLQKKLGIQPSLAAKWYRNDLKMIGIESLNSLCAAFNCTPNDILIYVVDAESARVSNTESSNSKESNTKSSISTVHTTQNESDNDRLLSTIEVAERLGVSRKSVNDYIIDGKLPSVKGKQNHNFVKLSDVLIYESVHGAKV
jgi:excisionase family DNA binding protein